MIQPVGELDMISYHIYHAHFVGRRTVIGNHVSEDRVVIDVRI